MEPVIRVMSPLIPLALLFALVAVPVYYRRYRGAPEPKRELSVLRYLAIVAGIGVAAFAGGTMLGIGVACSIPSAGNLCGLVGVFGTGPLLAAAGIFVGARQVTRGAMRAR